MFEMWGRTKQIIFCTLLMNRKNRLKSVPGLNNNWYGNQLNYIERLCLTLLEKYNMTNHG